MKKRLLVALSCAFAAIMALCLVGCSEPEPQEPANLTGDWKQANSASEDSYQQATITDDYIEIFWVSDGGDTKSLYWAGTYTAPTEPGDYSWDSENDTEKTSKALMASPSETKTFNYTDADKTISYEASALGTTSTIKLEKVEE